METAKLGTTGPEVTRVGFGGCPLGGHGWGSDCDCDESVLAVRCALEQGINFFDTADVYGLGVSEQLLAKALGDHRHEVVIATKFGVRWDGRGRTWKDISPTYLRRALEASLRRLGIDCVPLYYVHWPDGKTPIEDAIGEMDRCRQEGKIRAIGVSNFSGEQLRRAADVAPITAIQLQYSLVDRENAEAIRPTAGMYDVPLVTWGSLAQGLLTGKYHACSSFSMNDRRHRYENFLGDKFKQNLEMVTRLKEMSSRIDRSPAQIALRWLLDSRGVGCVLAGAKRPSQVEENIRALGWHLDSDDYELLASIGAILA